MELKGRRVLVLGLGETGMSMARWCAARGAQVRVADSREAPPYAARLAEQLPGVPLATGPFRPQSFAAVDMIAISPGVALAEPLVARAQAGGVPVMGDIELFAQAKDARSAVIAITGSNGKSTVTSMVADMCRAAGGNVVMAGNIGVPVLDTLASSPSPELYVLELSSFQLETTFSLDATAATVLNVSEDHLDRYAGMDAYAAAKARIFRGGGMQVLNRDDARSLGMRLPGRRAVTFGLDVPADGAWGVRMHAGGPWLAEADRPLMPVAELGVPGLHNAANALAALALVSPFGYAQVPMLDALRGFRGLPHRMQPVAELRGVTFYNDSKGTNVGATVAALAGLGRRCVLIAGGDGKGQDFGPLADPVRAHARAVVLIGRDAERIARALAPSRVALLRARTLEDAVAAAYGAAQPGDAVLLSPACASYDMFRDYRHRGEAFVQASRALAASGGGVH